MNEYVIIQKDNLTAMGDVMRDAYGETKLYTLDEMISGLKPIPSEDVKQNMIRYIEGNFDDLFKLPISLTSIGNSAFYNRNDLTSITLPETITSIDNYAFMYCSNLVSINLPKSLTSIGNYAFSNCTNLATINFPENLKNIGPNAFNSCKSLVSITLPRLTYIYRQTFEFCDNLTTINVPWAKGEVDNAPWGATNATINYNYTEESVLPEIEETQHDVLIEKNTIKSLCDTIREHYGNSENLPISQIPKKIIDIFGENEEEFCKLIQRTVSTFIIPTGTKNISHNTFRKCTGLTSVTIPNSVTSIGTGAFNECDNLTTINVPWAEGEVAGAPWNATNATINYNYTG